MRQVQADLVLLIRMPEVWLELSQIWMQRSPLEHSCGYGPHNSGLEERKLENALLGTRPIKYIPWTYLHKHSEFTRSVTNRSQWTQFPIALLGLFGVEMQCKACAARGGKQFYSGGVFWDFFDWS